MKDLLKYILGFGVLLSFVGLLGLSLPTLPVPKHLSLIAFLLGAFITAYGLVASILQRRGIERFALGAILSTIGITLLYLPAVAVLYPTPWYPATSSVQFGTIALALFLILLGFTMEATDLNKKVAKALLALYDALVETLQKVNWKYFLHPANILGIAAILLLAFPSSSLFRSYLPPFVLDYRYWVAALLFLLNFIFLFPNLTLQAIRFLSTTFSSLFRMLARSLKDLPHLLRKAFNGMNYALRQIAHASWRLLTFLASENYIFMFAAAFLSLLNPNWNWDVRVALAIILIVASFGRMTLLHSLGFANSISYVRAQGFRVSTKAKRVLSFRKTPSTRTCPACGSPMSKGSRCIFCRFTYHKDMISGSKLAAEDTVVQCPHCQQFALWEYMQQWLRFRPYCPYCKQPLTTDQLHPHAHGHDVPKRELPRHFRPSPVSPVSPPSVFRRQPSPSSSPSPSPSPSPTARKPHPHPFDIALNRLKHELSGSSSPSPSSSSPAEPFIEPSTPSPPPSSPSSSPPPSSSSFISPPSSSPPPSSSVSPSSKPPKSETEKGLTLGKVAKLAAGAAAAATAAYVAKTLEEKKRRSSSSSSSPSPAQRSISDELKDIVVDKISDAVTDVVKKKLGLQDDEEDQPK